ELDDMENENDGKTDDMDDESTEIIVYDKLIDESRLIKIYDLPAVKNIYFSGSFGQSVKSDFTYSIEQGIKDNYLSDYDIIIPIIPKDANITDCLVYLLHDKPGLNYILAYCNSRESGKNFCKKLNDNDITAIYLDGEDNIKKR